MRWKICENISIVDLEIDVKLRVVFLFAFSIYILDGSEIIANGFSSKVVMPELILSSNTQ